VQQLDSSFTTSNSWVSFGFCHSFGPIDAPQPPLHLMQRQARAPISSGVTGPRFSIHRTDGENRGLMSQLGLHLHRVPNPVGVHERDGADPSGTG
jgi:hypothetical protein